METTFARWLGDTKPYAFAQSCGLNRRTVEQLALGRCNGRQSRSLYMPVVERVAEITGIPAGVLVEEALRAREDPSPSRRYMRKEAAE